MDPVAGQDIVLMTDRGCAWNYLTEYVS